MSSISLGRYVPYDTVVHNLDARNKIFCLIALMIAVFIPYSSWGMTFIVGGVLALFIFALLLVARVSIRDIFKSLRVLWFLIIVLLLVNVLVPSKGAEELGIAFSVGNIPIYWNSILQSLKIILRLVLMIELTVLLTASTKPLDLTYALEWYMTPLRIVKFPTHEVAMVISIALRFIPTLLDETSRIMKAQSSRGVDFNHGSISSRLKAIVSLIIPLFISAFQRSDELADSMEARGYDPNAQRTRYRIMKFKWSDLLGFFVVVIILTSTILLSTCGVTII